MMIGSGFTKDMISSSRNNRKLLKEKSSTYKHFDTSAYGFIQGQHKPVRYKEASEEQLKSIRLQMKKDNQLLIKRKLIILFSLSVILFFLLTFLIQWQIF